MKATLTFDLDDPHDRELYAAHNQAVTVHLFLWELTRNTLRGICKYDSLSCFTYEDTKYCKDIDGNDIQLAPRYKRNPEYEEGTDIPEYIVDVPATPIDKISGSTMVTMIRSMMQRTIYDEGINLDVLS